MNNVQEALGEAVDGNTVAVRTGPAGTALRLARRSVHNLLALLGTGRLHLHDPLGNRDFGISDTAAAPDVAVRITDLSAYRDIAAGGTLGAAEAYMAGKWTTPDLPGVVRLMVLNRDVMNRLDGGLPRLGGLILKLAHWRRRNTRTRSRRNIHAHYDLGNELFQLFLDPALMYSSAVFPRPDASLEEASLHKLDLICRKLELSPADHLLEIGTGWGGLAVHAARNFGCRVTTTTISQNQFGFATERVRQAGLADRITVLSEDYRDLRGSFDKLVSVEMIEAVGHRYLDGYFRVCSERLKPTGRMLLQAITIADRHYEQARRSVDFIQKYIFPGGALPSCATLLSSVSRVTDLQLTGLQDIGPDYARTLQLWRERFLHRVQDVRRLGYPDEFIRMWEWYLAYCEGGFLERAISAVQVVFDKPGCRLQPRRWAAAPLLAACLAVTACTSPAPALDTGAPTYDGMVPVRDSGMREAWLKPDIDLGTYRQMLLLPVEVQFRAVRPAAGTVMGRSRDREFPISPADQQRLVELVTEVFQEELAKSRHLTLTTEPGPDVLLIRTSLLDIVSQVPPEEPGRNEIFLDQVGAATLVLELQDAQSGETLARAVDRRAADPVDDLGTNVSRVTSVQAWSEVRRVARRWASAVTHRIDQLYTRSRMPGQDPAQPLH